MVAWLHGCMVAWLHDNYVEDDVFIKFNFNIFLLSIVAPNIKEGFTESVSLVLGWPLLWGASSHFHYIVPEDAKTEKKCNGKNLGN
jgi:hypothetical protein